MMLFIPSFAWTFLGHSILLLTWYDIFWFSTQVLISYDLFWNFESNAFLTNWYESALGSSSISRRLESIQPCLERLSRNRLRINSKTEMNSQVFIQIDPFLPNLPILRFKSTHDSSEKKHLTSSRLMIRLWVIPMSASHINREIIFSIAGYLHRLIFTYLTVPCLIFSLFSER